MSSIEDIVIVGGGLAGAAAAETLRAEGFDGRITLFADEPEPPYERPPLTKDYLRGESAFEKAVVHPASWYDEQKIDLALETQVTAIDPRESVVTLRNGRRRAFDRLLLATGSAPRTLDVPGKDLDGVHLLRTRAHADAIRKAAASAGQVVVVGGGWIGTEVAASIRQAGAAVTLVTPDAVPLERPLGTEVASIIRDLHLEHGVDIKAGRTVIGFGGRTGVESVHLSDGSWIPADLVVVGIGALPRVELASSAGLAVENGVVVDEFLTTSDPAIFAAGDVAAAWHPVFEARIRVEHWDNARRQGRVAARNMLGGQDAYERIPFFFTDQFDFGMEYAGHAPRWDRVVFRGDPESRKFIAFWLDGDRVVAGMNANIWKVNGAISALVRSRADVDVARLVDEDVPLTDIDEILEAPGVAAA
jgi:3-phenylpropionate/trans-cinnamate dioxygenase ferredoxin reductase subunit